MKNKVFYILIMVGGVLSFINAGRYLFFFSNWKRSILYFSYVLDVIGILLLLIYGFKKVSLFFLLVSFITSLIFIKVNYQTFITNCLFLFTYYFVYKDR